MKKRKPGRPEFEPSQEQRKEVIEYASKGVPQETIAQILDIDRKTLTKYFEPELKKGKANCTKAYINTLYTLANTEKIPSAVFFYLKTQEGWRERDLPTEQQQPITLNFKRGTTRVSKTINEDKEDNVKGKNE